MIPDPMETGVLGTVGVFSWSKWLGFFGGGRGGGHFDGLSRLQNSRPQEIDESHLNDLISKVV